MATRRQNKYGFRTRKPAPRCKVCGERMTVYCTQYPVRRFRCANGHTTKRADSNRDRPLHFRVLKVMRGLGDCCPADVRERAAELSPDQIRGALVVLQDDGLATRLDRAVYKVTDKGARLADAI